MTGFARSTSAPAPHCGAGACRQGLRFVAVARRKAPHLVRRGNRHIPHLDPPVVGRQRSIVACTLPRGPPSEYAPGMDVPVPRFPLPTLGGKQLWADVFLFAGYRIQQNVLTKHHRLLDPTDAKLAVGSWDHCHKTFLRVRETREVAPTSDHLVLLLHGIFRSKDSFGPMTRALRVAGYEAHSINYPSTRQSLEDHADQVEALLNRAEGVTRLSLVTHSMGGIVARVLLSRVRSPWRRRIALHRLVMIATPNKGSEIALRLDNVPAFGAVAGPSMQQLHPTRINELPRPDMRFGIIAGARGDARGFNPLLPGDDDMTVTVESTKLEGAEDFLVVPGAVHTFIMVSPDVVAATLRYLDTGRLLEPTDLEHDEASQAGT